MSFGDEIRARQLSMGNRGVKRQCEYSDEFYTPVEIVRALGSFDMDPCAGPMAHAAINIRLPECGLRAEWRGRVWMNPPYLHIHEWLEKFRAHGDGVALVNDRADTNWFQTFAAASSGLLFIRRRVQFGRPDKPTGHGPVGSVLVAYGRRNYAALLASGIDGLVTAVTR